LNKDKITNDLQLELFPAADKDAARSASVEEHRKPSPAAPDPLHDNALRQSLWNDLKASVIFPVDLTITDNTSTLMSLRTQGRGGLVKIRLHRMFLDAPPNIRKALVHWMQHPHSKVHKTLFLDFMNANKGKIAKRSAASRSAVTQGKVYDLHAIYKQLNQRYFEDTVKAVITWGRDNAGKQKSIRFGSYSERSKTIRIHPRLDQAFVPDYFVISVVYHEMLHAHLGIGRKQNGMRDIHSSTFKKRERLFHDHEKALAWIGDPKHLKKLLSKPRPG
jgi:hypothetical protein